MDNKIKLIIDTDIGSDIDDALCLAYLLKQPRCEILGITTCSFEPEKRAEIADATVRSFGKNIPVYPGRENPIYGPQLQVSVHQYDVVSNFEHRRDFKKNSAIEFMRNAIVENPGEVVILAIGPLTNVGALFCAYPELVDLVKEVSILGGCYFEEWKSKMPVEFNIKNDALAAGIVFSTGAKIRVGGLDVSMATKTDCDAFIASDCEDSRKLLIPYIKKFRERTNDMYYHDAIAAVWLFENDICSFIRGNVTVDFANEWGRTDFESDENGNVLVAEKIDVDAFFRHYESIV